jgi:hypothetical protein
MKFLAMLKDAVREAVDHKVLYVMVGLSVLLALLALSTSYAAAPGANEVVRRFAVLPLNNDTAELGQAEALHVLFQKRPIQFDATSVEPLDGEPDAPASRLKVRLSAGFNSAAAADQAKESPKQVEDFIRERFGLIEGKYMMRAEEVRLVKWEGFDLPILNLNVGNRKAVFEVVAAPTPVTVRFWPHRLSLFFGLVPVGGPGVSFPLFQQLNTIEGVIVGSIGSTIAVLVSVVITAFFIPNMLRKGTVDLLLVKPIHRSTLLVYKFVGGLAFIFINTAVAVGGIWLALGLRSGVWAPTFLLTVLVLTFYFAILYSVSALFGVLTRSPIAAILLTCAAWFALFIVGVMHNLFEVWRGIDRTAQAIQARLGEEGVKALQGAGGEGEGGNGRRGRPVTAEDLRFHENWFTRGVSVVHAVLPRTTDLGNLMARRLQHDLALGEVTLPARAEKPPPELPGGIPLPEFGVKPPSALETFGVSAVFIALMLGIACWWFATKDY